MVNTILNHFSQVLGKKFKKWTFQTHTASWYTVQKMPTFWHIRVKWKWRKIKNNKTSSWKYLLSLKIPTVTIFSQ